MWEKGQPWEPGQYPLVAQNADGRLELFQLNRFPNNEFVCVHQWQASPNSTSWSGWNQLGPTPQPASHLCIAQNASLVNGQLIAGNLEAFIIDPSGLLFHIWQSNNWGVGWTALPGGGQGKALTVGRNADGHLEVFIIGTDNVVYHNWQTPNGSEGWTGWSQLGPTAQQAQLITVGQNGDGRLELFAIGPNQVVYHTYQLNNWSTWQPLGPTEQTGSFVTVARNQDGRLEVFLVALDGHIYHSWQTAQSMNNWSNWSYTDLGPPLGAGNALAAARNPQGELELFRFGDGYEIVSNHQTSAGGGWSGWTEFGIPPRMSNQDTFTSLTLASNQNGEVELFTTGNYANTQTSNGSWGGWLQL